MARSPQISQSAERSLLPSARFGVRSASGADFGGAEAAAIQQIAGEAGRLGGTLETLDLIRQRDQKQLRDFQLNTDFIQFAADEQSALTEAGQNMESGGWEFQKNFLLGHAARFEEWASAKGLDERERAEYTQRGTELRRTFSSAALGAEFAERERFYTERTNVTLDQLRTGIDQTPEGFDNLLEQGMAVIDQSGLTPAQKDSRKLEWQQQAAYSYGAALVNRDAGSALLALGGALPEPQPGEYTGPAGGEVRGHYQFFRDNGFSDVAAAALVGVLSWESGGGLEGINPNGRNPGDGTDGTDSIGAAQWNSTRAEALKAFARSKGKPWNDLGVQLEFVVHELKTTEPEAYRRLMAARTIEDAVEATNWYERPQGFRPGGRREAVGHWAQRVERAKHFAGQIAQAPEPQPDQPAGEPAQPRLPEPTDPRLASLSYEARLQLRGAALRGVQAEIQMQQQAIQAQQDEEINALELKLIDGTAGREDIDAARSTGVLSDASDVSRLLGIVESREKETSDITTFDGLWNDPATAWNPYDAGQRDAVDAAWARSPNPQTLQAIVQRTGIVPKQALSTLRGQLLSTNPSVVQGAATLSSNIMASRPNAFTALDGGRDVEEAGVRFNHLVNELGYTAQEAATRIAQENDPQNRARVRVGEPEINTFRRELTQTPVSRIARQIVTPGALYPFNRPRFLSREQEVAITQDYADLALDHFRRYGDEGQAKAWADDRIERLYGASNGTIIKYPPERVYPAVGNSHAYIYEQAASAIQAVDGRTVRPGDVWLTPLPTVTAEAWRRGQPAPYLINYVYENEQGQRVYDTVPGGFSPDPRPVAARVTEERRDQFTTRNQNRTRLRQGQQMGGQVGVIVGTP